MLQDTFQSKMTIRIYSTALRGELSNAYSNSNRQFENKNHFLVSLINLGLEQYLQESRIKNEKFKTNDLDKQINELKVLLDDFIKFTKKQTEINDAHFKVCEKLSASILNILVALSNRNYVDEDDIENGRYEDIPNRLERIILDAKYK